MWDAQTGRSREPYAADGKELFRCQSRRATAGGSGSEQGTAAGNCKRTVIAAWASKTTRTYMVMPAFQTDGRFCHRAKK